MVAEEVRGAPTTATNNVLDELQRHYETFKWRGHDINYFVAGPGDGKPVLLVHGFGGSINHWRRTIPALIDKGGLRVYAVDLLGFGGSAKPSPKEVVYSLELWRDLVIDFVEHFDPACYWSLVGNSIGSLVALLAADALGESRVRACALMNCAGGLTSFRREELSVLGRIAVSVVNGALFNPVVGGALFRTVRSPETLRKVLTRVYSNAEAVDDSLIDIIGAPAFDAGACEVFLAVFNADAGPRPFDLLPRMEWCPLLVCWGLDDTLTPYATGFSPGERFSEFHSTIRMVPLEDCGHCPHDDRPEAVNSVLVPFLTE